ncbi:hypothetical protein BC835DRAFT_90395 [Cytidiella melzeri]|nr:hypothetical protein BC835DRAFT_90395 [Cytidiella melzeri]
MLSTRPVTLSDDGPSHHAYSWTPAEALLKSRGALQENTIRRGSKTVNGKSRAVLLRTPQNPTSLRKKGLQSAKPTLVITRPLGDKTPFPNRQAQALQTPAPQAAKIAKLSLLDDALAKTPGNLLLPSARRKSMRLPRSASQKFKTPRAQGHHWDVSDGDVEASVGEENEGAEIEEADYDEIEYMPPKVPEQPFEPLFELPDYELVGKTLLTLIYSGPYDASTERHYAADVEAVIDTTKILQESGGLSTYHLDLSDLFYSR